MKLNELKTAVYALYAKQGKTAKSLVNDIVREYGDLRLKATWQRVYDNLTLENDLARVTTVEQAVSVVKPAVASFSEIKMIDPMVVIHAKIQLKLILEHDGIKVYMT